MQDHVNKYDLSQKDRRLLVGGIKAKKILLATPLLKWYIEHGLVVTDVYQVIEFTPKACFKPFEKQVTTARRIGDEDSSKQIIADTMKLIGNSAYGSLIMDKEKHQNVKYVRSKRDACIAINQPVFRKVSELDDDVYEIESVKKSITLDLPIYLGYFILQYAKLKMLQFYYDCIDNICDRSDFEYMEMDTDSAYIALSEECLEDIIKPEKRAEHDHLLFNKCDTVHSLTDTQWFPRECCPTHKLHDKRTPGLFKLEAEGSEMVAFLAKHIF